MWLFVVCCSVGLSADLTIIIIIIGVRGDREKKNRRHSYVSGTRDTDTPQQQHHNTAPSTIITCMHVHLCLSLSYISAFFFSFMLRVHSCMCDIGRW